MKTYYILAKLENGNSRLYKTETTSKKAAASEIRANGWWMLDALTKDYCDQCEIVAF